MFSKITGETKIPQLFSDNKNKNKILSIMNNSANNEKNSPDSFDGVELLSSKCFDIQENIVSNKRTYLLQYEETRTTYIAVELLLKNQNYRKKDVSFQGTALWFFEEEEVGRNNFKFESKNEWEIVEFVQTWGTPVPGFWKSGNGFVEIYLENILVCKHNFKIGSEQIIDFDTESIETKKTSLDDSLDLTNKLKHIHNEVISLDSILAEINNFVGLEKLKQSLSDFLTYINFIQERKRLGINTDESITANCIFLGNPGTGKTSIARLLGKYFKAIGLLENGHVIEVDRSALVGEYVGETAQKTEKVISQAMGGILFIDEAYSLKREKSGADFGQEAIDIILKRMEDHKGKFFVIAAGYPNQMKLFLDSNPGLKSRFTHHFIFEDYSAKELLEIFKIFAAREKYHLNEDAERVLTLKLQAALEKKDESFGNARFVRNLFDMTKIELSKRFRSTPAEEKDLAQLTRFNQQDVSAAFESFIKRESSKSINEDKIVKLVNEFNSLVGLEDVKTSFGKLLASIKVEQLKKDKHIDSNPRNLNSIFISEKGLGTTNVAKLFAKIFKELSLIENSQIIEINPNSFAGLNKIDSYLFIDKVFQNSAGKVLVVNEAVTALQAKGDFSDSLLQYFLKKVYLSSSKTVTILVDSETELEAMMENVPVISNQFPNQFNFETYTTRQLLEIALNICQKKNYQLDEGAWQLMMDILNRSRMNPDFAYVRTVNSIIEKAITAQEERILALNSIKEEDLMTIIFEDIESLEK